MRAVVSSRVDRWRQDPLRTLVTSILKPQSVFWPPKSYMSACRVRRGPANSKPFKKISKKTFAFILKQTQSQWSKTKAAGVCPRLVNSNNKQADVYRCWWSNDCSQEARSTMTDVKTFRVSKNPNLCLVFIHGNLESAKHKLQYLHCVFKTLHCLHNNKKPLVFIFLTKLN